MEFLVLGDLHLGGIPKIVREDQREFAHDSIFNQVEEYARQNNVDHIIQLGDVFDSPNPPEKLKMKLLARLAKSRQDWYFIKGNHDYLDVENCSLNLFKQIADLDMSPNVKWFLEPDTLVIEKQRFVFLPWPYSVHKFTKPKEAIVLAHVPIIGAKMDNGKLFEEEEYKVDLGNNFWFIGDLHLKQSGKGYCYPGAPLQLRFNDELKRYFVHAKCKNGKVEYTHVPLESPYTLKQVCVDVVKDVKKLEKLKTNEYASVKLSEGLKSIKEEIEKIPNIKLNSVAKKENIEDDKISVVNEDTQNIRFAILHSFLKKGDWNLSKEKLDRAIQIARETEAKHRI